VIEGIVPDDVDMLAALHLIQHEFGYVPPEAIPLLAERLQTTPALIYGAIDFYSEIRQSPPAETVVEWCSGPACLLKNSSGIRRALEATLGCAMNEATADGKFELRLVQCDGTCELAPLLRHEGKYIGPLTASAAIEFARELRQKAGVPLVANRPPPEAAASDAAASESPPEPRE